MTTAYEIYGRGFGWNWRLRADGRVIATGAAHHDSSGTVRDVIDRVRAAVTTLDGDDHAFRDTTVRDPGMVVERIPTPEGELSSDRDDWVWRLETAEAVLGHSADRFSTETAVRTAAQAFLAAAVGGLPSYIVGAEYDWQDAQPSIHVGTRGMTGPLRELLRGYRHRRALDRFDTRIAVVGSRGKSSTVRRLDDVIGRRGYGRLSKVTGDRPLVVLDGEVYLVDRQGPRTLLYENARIVQQVAAELDPAAFPEVAIIENQGITPYTTRLVNRTFSRVDIVVVTNVRKDHVGTLGTSRRNIARALGRSVGPDTHVVSAEQHPELCSYLRAEVERRGATFEQVSVPGRHEGLLGAETVHAIDPVLEAIDEDPVDDAELDAFLRSIQPEWVQVDGGRVYNAADVNDVESTERVRRILAGRTESILPFVFLRADRRGRTASFATYAEWLVDHDHAPTVHVAGGDAVAFQRNADAPVTVHDTADPGDVLDALLSVGPPVLLMGNTVDEFMRGMTGAVAERREVRRLTRVTGTRPSDRNTDAGVDEPSSAEPSGS